MGTQRLMGVNPPDYAHLFVCRVHVDANAGSNTRTTCPFLRATLHGLASHSTWTSCSPFLARFLGATTLLRPLSSAILLGLRPCVIPHRSRLLVGLRRCTSSPFQISPAGSTTVAPVQLPPCVLATGPRQDCPGGIDRLSLPQPKLGRHNTTTKINIYIYIEICIYIMAASR